MKRSVVLSLAFIVVSFTSTAQNIGQNSNSKNDTLQSLKFNYKKFILPTVVIGYGVIGLESDQLKIWNYGIQDELQENIDSKITIDDFSQWAPAASVYALNAFGVEGKSSFRDRSVILATSYAIVASTVFSLKTITKIERPDGSSNNSFPSGHTATAFASAEFLWQEYKDKSIWYGVAGFAIATGTGFFRMYNNRHWFTDVVAGAGIGILSTKLAYWLNPYVTNTLFGKNQEKKSTAFIMPVYDGSNIGISFVKTF